MSATLSRSSNIYSAFFGGVVHSEIVLAYHAGEVVAVGSAEYCLDVFVRYRAARYFLFADKSRMPVGGYVAVDILFDLAYVVDYGARTPGGYVYLQAPAFTGRGRLLWIAVLCGCRN